MVSFIAADASFGKMKKLGKRVAIGVVAFYVIKGIVVTAIFLWLFFFRN
jgi:hypothetical protein